MKAHVNTKKVTLLLVNSTQVVIDTASFWKKTHLRFYLIVTFVIY